MEGKKFKEIWEAKNQNFGLKILQTYIKIEKKNLQFFGVNNLKIRQTVVEIKFMKGKKFKEILGQNFEFSFLKFL